MRSALRPVSRAVFRGTLFSLAAAACAIGVAAAARSVIAQASPTRNAMSLDLIPRMAYTRAALVRYPEAERILIVGDSVLSTETSLPVSLVVQRGLRKAWKQERPFSIGTLSWSGWSVSSEYTVMDDLIRMNPDRVVLEVNARALGWKYLALFGFPELAGHILPSRYPEAFSLSLSPAGITLNRALFYRLLLQCGLEPLFSVATDVQAKLFDAHATLERSFEHLLHVSTYDGRRLAMGIEGLNHLLVFGKNRENKEHALLVSEAALSGLDEQYQPFVTLGVIVRRLAAARKRPLVFLAPMNVEHLRTLGLDLSRLDVSVGALRRVVEKNGGVFADFHSILHDAQFGDSGDHPTTNGDDSGAAVLGNRIAVAIDSTER